MKNSVLFVCISGVLIASTCLILGQPINDDLAARIILSGTNATVTASNAGATRQADEPENPYFTNSVWWEWTAPADGTLRVTASAEGFAPAVLIYALEETNHLYVLDSTTATPAEASLIVYRDQKYCIAAGGLNGGSGEFELGLQFMRVPPNDNFANRLDLGSGECQTNGWLFLATYEPGELALVPSPDPSVWYSWTASQIGPATFSVPQSQIALHVFTGSDLLDLQLLASSEARGPLESAQATIEAQAGVTYHIRVSVRWDLSASFFNLSGSAVEPM